MWQQKWNGMAYPWHFTFMVMWVQLHMYMHHMYIYICPDYGLNCNKWGKKRVRGLHTGCTKSARVIKVSILVQLIGRAVKQRGLATLLVITKFVCLPCLELYTNPIFQPFSPSLASPNIPYPSRKKLLIQPATGQPKS